MSRLVFFAAVCALALSSAVRAADTIVSVTDQDGAAAADAVVSVWPSEPGRDAPGSAPQGHIVDQSNEAFVPFVTIMRRGDHVQFINSDRTRHHVYSFSEVKQFELILNPGQKSAPVKFDQAGVAAIGCNIHDQMLAYAFVTETPWVALTNAQGRATIKDLPKGTYRAGVWHPRIDADAAAPDQSLEAGSANVAFTLRLTPARSERGHQRHY
jgi:plastocyanin